MYFLVKGSGILSGEYYAPPSKSHSFRALMLALRCNKAEIKNILKSEDVDNFVEIIHSLGIKIIRKNTSLFLENIKEKRVKQYYNLRNSGTALRFFVSYLSDIKKDFQRIVLDGDFQLRGRKIIGLLDSLKQNGIDYSIIGDSEIPFSISGKLKPGNYEIYAQSSQFLSSLLLTLPFMNGKSEIKVNYLAEQPYIEMTLRHLERIGADIVVIGDYEKFKINPFKGVRDYFFEVPGDFSSASYFMAADILSNGKVVFNNLDMNDTQGDKSILNFLKMLGVNYLSEGNQITLIGQIKKGGVLDLGNNPDIFPTLAFLLSQYPYHYKFVNLHSLRNKETDRLKVAFDNMLKNGIKVKMTDSSLEFLGNNKISKFKINAENDHRIIMAATLFGVKKGNFVSISNVDNLRTSYPGFLKDMRKLGLDIKVSRGTFIV